MEYIEPTASSRRKLAILFVGTLVIGLLILAFRDEFLVDVLALPPCEGVEIIRRLFWVIFIVVLIGFLWGGRAARKSLELDQWPLPGTWVFRRTPIRRGRIVKWRAYALLSLSVVAIFLGVRSWYLLEQFVGRVKLRHCPSQTAMQPNKSLERTVVYRGRTVRAVAMSARAGANGQLWPAAQLGR